MRSRANCAHNDVASCGWERSAEQGGILLSFAMILLVAACSSNPVQSDLDAELQQADSLTTKVLFIGSSYFSFNDLPALLKGLADSSGKRVVFAYDIIDGTYLKDHVQSAATPQMIRKAQWDYLLLQDAGPQVGYPETHGSIVPPYVDRQTHWALTQLKQMAFQNCKESKLVFMMPWAFEDGLTWIKGQTDTYEEMQLKIYQNTLAWAHDIGFLVAPVGWAWRKVITERPFPHYLFMSDYNHPSYRGSYLTACVLYATMFKESVAGNGFRGGLSQGEAGYFQQIASQTVLDSLGLWNITLSRH